MNTIKYFCGALAVSAALLSAVLSFKFLFEVGQLSGLGFVFGAMAVVLDATKAVMPVAACYVVMLNKKPIAYILGVVYLILVAFSFSASMFTIDNAAQSSRTNSDHYQALSKQIVSLQNQAERQRDANQITNASTTEQVIRDLISERSKLQGESILDLHSKSIGFIVSAAIELVGLALTLVCLALGGTRQIKTSDSDRNSNGGDLVETKVKRTETKPTTITIEAKTTPQDEIKQIVRARAIHPSVSAIAKVFKISRNVINDALTDLEREGVLIRNGNRRRFV